VTADVTADRGRMTNPYIGRKSTANRTVWACVTSGPRPY